MRNPKTTPSEDFDFLRNSIRSYARYGIPKHVVEDMLAAIQRLERVTHHD